MTCVVAVEVQDGERRGVVMGADSCSSNGHTETVQSRSKLIRVGEDSENVELLVGITGSWRFADLIEYHLELTERPRKYSPETYVRKYLVRAVRSAAKENGLLHVKDGVEHLGDRSHGLIAYGGKLYWLHENLSVLPGADWGASVGSGADVAMGAMLAVKKLREEPSVPSEAAGMRRLRVALEVAAESVTTVSAPFTFQTLWASE